MKLPIITALTNGFNRLTGAIDRRDAAGESSVYRAVRAGDRREVRRLLELGADPNLAAKNGATPLHEAAYWNEEPIAALLIKYGADVALKDAHGWTPLHAAAVAGGGRARNIVIALLIRHGARDDVVDNQGWTPRDYMKLWEENPEAAEKLRLYLTGRQTLGSGTVKPPTPPKH